MSRLAPYLRVLAFVLVTLTGLFWLVRATLPVRGQMDDGRALAGPNQAVPVNAFRLKLEQPANLLGTDLPGAAELSTATGDKVKISINPATGKASFVRLLDGASLNLAPAVTLPEAQGRAFWAQYGSLFGVSAPDRELRLVETSQDVYGLTHLKYEQVYQGVKVFGGELWVHLNPAQAITSVNGVFIPDLNLDVLPSRSAAEAASLAINLLTSQGKPGDLAVVDSQLVIYRTGLVQRISGRDALAYALEISNPDHSLREFVYMDAQTGKLLDQFSGVQAGLSRKISENNFGNVVWQDSASNPDPIPPGWAGGTPQQVTDWQNEIDGASETYNLFASLNDGSYRSYDGSDAIMRTVNNDPTIQCPNANWNGLSTNYCSGVTGDDTVAHEWGHAYTEYTSNLVYAWQPGALNESYSDIWGEVVDMLNGRGKDSPLTLRTANTCSVYTGYFSGDHSYRWLSGEDDPALNSGRGIRDMWNPTCYSDPGKVSDAQYHCRSDDGGGVHTNSGVPNHAFALLVDGGTYNGQTLTGIGLTKAAHIEWAAQRMLTTISDFSDNADALEAACSDLVGKELPALSTSSTNPGLSGQSITADDCIQVSKVIAAVEFRSPPSQCNFTEILAKNPPAFCSGPPNVVSTIFEEDFEDGLGGWTLINHGVFSGWPGYDWTQATNLPGDRPGAAAFGADPDGGNCDYGLGDISGYMSLESPFITIPNTSQLRTHLAFDHYIATEAGWDGGNLKISINGGIYQDVKAIDFTYNPYNTNLESIIRGNTNPLAGTPGFSGTDDGKFIGSWGQSQIDLTTLGVHAGDKIKLRYDMGIDGCSGIDGWYIDNVQVYSCEGGYHLYLPASFKP